jgi:hypothetical protein
VLEEVHDLLVAVATGDARDAVLQQLEEVQQVLLPITEGRKKAGCRRKANDVKVKRHSRSTGVEDTSLCIKVVGALTGETWVDPLQMTCSDTVGSLQGNLARAIGISGKLSSFRLIHEGMMLADEKPLVLQGVTDGSTVEAARLRRSFELVLCNKSENGKISYNPKLMKVLSGSKPGRCYVGGQRAMPSVAQLPPARGDSWQIPFEADGGAYDIKFIGGSNCHHGILSVHIDDTPLSTFDQYALEDTYPTEHVLHWSGGQPGPHMLNCSVNDKRTESQNYWICLRSIVFDPVLAAE